MANFGRVYRLEFSNEAERFIVESQERHMLRIVFDIRHDPGGNNVFGQITIFNLSEDSKSRIEEQFTNVTLIAGYRDESDVIFRGRLINSVRGRDDADTNITLYCRAIGQRAFETDLNKTLPRNTTVLEVFRECAEAIGVPLEIDNAAFANDPVFGRGISLQGDPKVLLNNLRNSYDYDWLFENGRLVILKTGQTRRGEVLQISMLTGMVDTPELTEIGVNVVTRLNPKVRFGTQITVESNTPRINFSNLFFQNVPRTIGEGIYKVLRVTFIGDSHGDVWDSIIEAIRSNV